MSFKTYNRGQVEWALWRSFSFNQFQELEDVPKKLRTRIKRLLEIDRDLNLSNAEDPPKAGYAFAPMPSEESGVIAYRAVDTFCIAIALDLLDAGFKQSEVVFLMRYMRVELESRFLGLLKEPSLLSRQRKLARDGQDGPTYLFKGRRYLDGRHFVVLKKVEMTEVHPHFVRNPSEFPIFLEPEYFAGIETLTDALYELMPRHRRSVTILEIALLAQAVSSFLDKAPDISRGRPSKK